MPNIFPLSTECFESRFSFDFINGSNIIRLESTVGPNDGRVVFCWIIRLNDENRLTVCHVRNTNTSISMRTIQSALLFFFILFLKVDVDSIIKWNVNRSTTDFINGNQPCKSFNEPQNDDQNKWCKTFALSVNQVHRLNLISWLLHLLFVYLFLLIISFFQNIISHWIDKCVFTLKGS